MIGRTMPFLRRTLVLVFALVGFADIAVRLVLLPLTGTFFGSRLALPFGTTLERTVESPDGRYKALVFVEEGTGLDPHCVRIVSVVAKDKPARLSWGPADRVYVDDCTGFETLAWAPTVPSTLHGIKFAQPRLTIYAQTSSAWMLSRRGAENEVTVEFDQ